MPVDKEWKKVVVISLMIGAILSLHYLTSPYMGYQHAVYHQYSILCDRRDELRAFLGDRGVQSGVYYQVPLHLQQCFAALGYEPGALPVTEETCARILSIPCHPMLAEEDRRYVAACIGEFYTETD